MKKILSIDGGGIRGLIPAMVLAEIETRTRKPIAKSFDLIAGTSTGGILALGLSKDNGHSEPAFSANTLSEIYRQQGKIIFPQGTVTSALRHLWRGFGVSEEVYSHEGLESLLKDKLGEATLGDALTKVLISTYDIVDGEPLFLKSWNRDHQAVKMRDAARATSAAPTYFEPHQLNITYSEGSQYEKYRSQYEEYLENQTTTKNPEALSITATEIDGRSVLTKTHTLVDGGVFINSPAVSAYAEAQRLFPEESDFLVVSLGTGQVNPKVTYEEAKDWGLAYWVRPLIEFMFDGVSDAADYQLKHLLGDQPGRYYRMQIDIDEESAAMDLADDENIRRLLKSATQLIVAQDANLEELRGFL